MRYCARCLYPETKPDLSFDADGICSACRSYEARAAIDWNARAADFAQIVERYGSRGNAAHDCIVPVSGGKDSTYQAIKAREAGLNPLCVVATTDSLTPIGRRNIENLKSQGFDFIEVTTNPRARRIMRRFALREVGDISWCEHVSIFTIPVKMAAKLGIRLIVWGENPQNEYGGPAQMATGNTLTRRWLEEYGGLLGLRVEDFADQVTGRDLEMYRYPSDAELANAGVTGVFLGHYFPWDGHANALFAKAHGFETAPGMVEGSACDYENLDNYQTGIHDYFKFLKYGFGRATDIVSSAIRRGRMTRGDGLRLVIERDGAYPETYLGRPLDEILAEIGIDRREFDQICDRFTNKRIFCQANGALLKDSTGRPVPKALPC